MRTTTRCLAPILAVALWGCGGDAGDEAASPSAEGGGAAPLAGTDEPSAATDQAFASDPGAFVPPARSSLVDDPDPPTARRDLVTSLQEDRSTERHPSDGGGRGWIEGDATAWATRPGRFTLVYEAGPLGVAVGGMVFLQVSPYWGWSTPWHEGVDRPGYTTVECEAPGVTVQPVTVDRLLLAVTIEGRALREGERLRFVYGAGPARATADRYAERESPFWFAVDGDGDGVRGLVEVPATVDVAPGPPARLVVTAPSVVAPGKEARLVLAVLDGAGSAGVTWSGTLRLSAPAPLGLPAEVLVEEQAEGLASVPFTPSGSGVFKVEVAAADGGLEGTSNPILVDAVAEPILWGDLHGHSHLSDGTGIPEDYFRYAREVAALDVVSLTDHDHWGFPFLDATPSMWDRILAATEAHHEPGAFVTIPGYEWTSWTHGHRHVLSFEREPTLEVYSSLDEASETPRQLWDLLRGRPMLTVAHHSAGGPIAVNWTYRPDPELEPVTEVVSVHGSSEALDSPGRIYSPLAGNFVRDVLDRGDVLGFIGSGDSHDGHPGLAHLASASGGLVALLTGDRTRAGVLAALKARRCYATSGARMIVRSSLDGARMGSTIPAPQGPARLSVLVEGTAPLERIDLVRSGVVLDGLDLTAAEGEQPGEAEDTSALVVWTLDGLSDGEYVYLRVVQQDGHAAWTSPFFIRSGAPPADRDLEEPPR